MFKKFMLAASFTVLAGVVPASADIINFDIDGGGAVASSPISNLVWNNGNAWIAGTSQTPLNTPFQVYYQANLAVANHANGVDIIANNSGAAGTLDSITLVIGFREQITSRDPVTGTLTFGFVPGGQNFFQIYANDVPGNNLSGACFVCGTMIMAGSIIENDGLGHSYSSTFTPSGDVGALDQAGGPTPTDGDTDSYDSGDATDVSTLGGTGGLSLIGQVNPALTNPLYFSGLGGAVITFAFSNSTTQLPFQQVDPASCFFATTVLGVNTATNQGSLTPTCQGTGGNTGVAPFIGVGSVGAVNLLSGPNSMVQATGPSSFITQPAAIPEPATLTLLGVGLLSGAVARRRQQKGAK